VLESILDAREVRNAVAGGFQLVADVGVRTDEGYGRLRRGLVDGLLEYAEAAREIETAESELRALRPEDSGERGLGQAMPSEALPTAEPRGDQALPTARHQHGRLARPVEHGEPEIDLLLEAELEQQRRGDERAGDGTQRDRPLH
jgi:hypothetical protein